MCVCVVFVGLCVFIRDSRAGQLGFGTASKGEQENIGHVQRNFFTHTYTFSLTHTHAHCVNTGCECEIEVPVSGRIRME